VALLQIQNISSKQQGKAAFGQADETLGLPAQADHYPSRDIAVQCNALPG
jgi:hypothetical protein